MSHIESAATVTANQLATPRSSSSAFSSWWLQEGAARLGARIAARWDAPIRIGTRVIVARHAHIMEALSRDLDFTIAPINATRIDEVNGPFVLGMDRNAALAAERHALYRALGRVDLKPIHDAITDRARLSVEGSNSELDVVGEYARPVAADTAKSLFGVASSDQRTFEDVARAIFA